jgi:benzodiazapine receptor
MKSIYKLIISIVTTLAVGGISGFFTSSSVNGWFKTLNKPSFNPPAWLFAPVLTVLYILIGIAFYIIWNSQVKTEKKYTAYTYYWLQLLLNFGWSFLFFFYKRADLALIDIIVLFIMIASTIFSFRKISKTAAWLLVPYLCWVAFATALNFAIWKLN